MKALSPCEGADSDAICRLLQISVDNRQLDLGNRAPLPGNEDAGPCIVEKLGPFDSNVRDLLIGVIGFKIDAGARPRPLRVLESRVQHQQAIGGNDRHPLAAVAVGDHGAKLHIARALDVEPVAPHVPRCHAVYDNVTGVLIDVDAHAPFAFFAFVLVALSFERAACNRHIRHAGDGKNGIFFGVVGNRFESRIV